MSWALIVGYAALGLSILVVWMLMIGAVAYRVGSLHEPPSLTSSDIAGARVTRFCT
jgi:hypothetical protein